MNKKYFPNTVTMIFLIVSTIMIVALWNEPPMFLPSLFTSFGPFGGGLEAMSIMVAISGSMLFAFYLVLQYDKWRDS